MPKRFFKHKLLLDEHLPPRQRLARLNERFDVQHIVHDLHLGGMADAALHDLAVAQERIVLTSNVKDFRPLLREDSPGSSASRRRGRSRGWTASSPRCSPGMARPTSEVG